MSPRSPCPPNRSLVPQACPRDASNGLDDNARLRRTLLVGGSIAATGVIGFAVGYLISRLLGYPESVNRTVSIEVGMQNGGMAAALARSCAAVALAATP